MLCLRVVVFLFYFVLVLLCYKHYKDLSYIKACILENMREWISPFCVCVEEKEVYSVSA